jgi:hypothetical protein
MERPSPKVGTRESLIHFQSNLASVSSVDSAAMPRLLQPPMQKENTEHCSNQESIEPT